MNVVHWLGWKVGTSRGTSCGLSWDSPVMLQLTGQPVDPANRECPFVASPHAARVTCEKCKENIARNVDVDIARAPGSLPK